MFDFKPGNSPLLVSVPHSGTNLAEGQGEGMTEPGRKLVDTDWHVDRLYAFAADLGASLLVAHNSRYVVDLNRSPDDRPLYPGAGTGLVPLETFSGKPLYRSGREPDEAEKSIRVEACWRPYHDKLKVELDRLVADHGHAVLLDGHSIASRVPRLFDGRLPDLNLGTYDGKSCSEPLASRAAEVLASNEAFSFVRDGRFKGGYITRNYGRPDKGVHALQLEIAQACYMDESRPETFDPDRAAPLVSHLEALVESLCEWSPDS